MMLRLILIGMLILSTLVGVSQTIQDWDVRTYPGDSVFIHYDRNAGIREDDTSYTRSFESGKKVLWDISEYGQSESILPLYFDSVASTDPNYSKANLKVCYNADGQNEYKRMIQYWAIGDQVWYPNEMYQGFDNVCDIECATFSRSFKEPNLRYSFPIVFGEAYESKTRYTDASIQRVGSPIIYIHFLSGETKVIGFGRLKTVAGDYEKCYLVEEVYNQIYDGMYPGEAIFKRWSWIHLKVKWPIAILEEWISLYPSSARVTVSNAYMIQSKSSEQLLGLDKPKDQNLDFFPNPSGGMIRSTESFSGLVSIYSKDGQLVKQFDADLI